VPQPKNEPGLKLDIERVMMLSCEGCGTLAPNLRRCPKCRELNLSPEIGNFCGQDCLKASWKKHKRCHVASPWPTYAEEDEVNAAVRSSLEGIFSKGPDTAAVRYHVVEQALKLPLMKGDSSLRLTLPGVQADFRRTMSSPDYLASVVRDYPWQVARRPIQKLQHKI